jgi:hypothetical protein
MAAGGYPTFPWWPLYNSLHGREDLRGDEVLIGGPIIAASNWTIGDCLLRDIVAIAPGISMSPRRTRSNLAIGGELGRSLDNRSRAQQ